VVDWSDQLDPVDAKAPTDEGSASAGDGSTAADAGPDVPVLVMPKGCVGKNIGSDGFESLAITAPVQPMVVPAGKATALSFLVHGVKCAIVPKDRHQNPPDDVIDLCAPRHLGEELKLIRPSRIVAFGKAPYRALLKVPGIEGPKGLGVSKSVGELVAGTRGGVAIQADGWSFQLHVSPFPLSGRRPDPTAEEVLREAARLSGISCPEISSSPASCV
jgi:hypothetical protein